MRFLSPIMILIATALLATTAANFSHSQERERAEAEAKAKAVRQRVNQMEKQYKSLQGNLNEINAWLEKNRGEEFAERREQLMGQRKELMIGLEKIKSEFARMRERNQAKEREQERDRSRAKKLTDEQNANRLESLYKKYTAQLEDINAFLEKNQKDIAPKRKEQLMGQRKELMAALAEIKAHFAAARKQRENKEQAGKRTKVNPEVQTAINRLKHFEHALEHLREAGAGEIAQIVEERAEKMRQIIRNAQERRKVESDRERSRGERANADEAFRKEIIGAIRELNAAVRSLQKEVGELKGRKR